MEHEVLQAIIKGRNDLLNEKIEEARIAAELGRTKGYIAPRPNEARHARRLWQAILDGVDNAVIHKMLAPLPMTIGFAPVLDPALARHIELVKDWIVVEGDDGTQERVAIEVTRKGEKSPWRLYVEVFNEMNPDPDAELVYPELSGWSEPITDNAGYVTCPGWARLVDGEVVDHHPCGDQFLVIEAWHKWRCPSCKKSVEKARGVKVRGGSHNRPTVATIRHRRRIIG